MMFHVMKASEHPPLPPGENTQNKNNEKIPCFIGGIWGSGLLGYGVRIILKELNPGDTSEPQDLP